MGHIATLREIRFWRVARAVGYVVGAVVVILGVGHLIGRGIPEAVLQCVT